MTIITQTKYLNFKSAKAPSGKDWFYVQRTNDKKDHDSAVVITTLVKIDGAYNFLLLKTRRPPLTAENKAKFCLESPAGLIGDNDCFETLIECAKKELLEEAGLRANKIFVELTNCSTSSGLSSETLSYTTAFVENYEIIQKPISDGGIIVERFFVPADNILSEIQKLNKKEISIASATICGIYFAVNRLNLL